MSKEFLNSKALHHLEGKSGHIDFFLPKCGPSNKGIQCLNLSEITAEKNEKTNLVIKEIQEEDQAPSKGKGSKKRAHIMESEVRRSPRLQKVNNGSKPSGCPDRKCLACSPSTPTLSTKVIKNLGVQLCNMNPESLKDEVLKKRKKGKLVIKKQAVRESDEQMTHKEEEPADRNQDADEQMADKEEKPADGGQDGDCQ